MIKRIGGTEILEHQARFPVHTINLYTKPFARPRAELLLKKRDERDKASGYCADCLLNKGTEGFPARLLDCSGITNSKPNCTIRFRHARRCRREYDF